MLIHVPPTKTPIREIAKMLMVITATADEFMKRLNILLPSADLELVSHVYKSWTDCSVSVYFSDLICICLPPPPHRGTSPVERSSSSRMWRGG